MREDALRELSVNSDAVQRVGLQTLKHVEFTHELLVLLHGRPVVAVAADDTAGSRHFFLRLKGRYLSGPSKSISGKTPQRYTLYKVMLSW